MKTGDTKDSHGKKVVHIKHWSEGDRPGERLLQRGPEGLSDAALLALLLGGGGQEKRGPSLAREMLAQFGGFTGLMSATREDLISIQGIGKTRSARILAAMEILKRMLRRPLTRLNLIENPDYLHTYLRATMGDLNREEFRVLFLNPSRHLISEEVLFRGSTDTSVVDPRQLAASALKKRASALILAHNHPMDLPMLSDEDIQLTKALVKACLTDGIPILDHVVIGRNTLWSMKRHYSYLFEGENDIA